MFVYDQYLKDANDDVDDNYYMPDPDRFSNLTLVFDTTSGKYQYPTQDDEMNALIDNTLVSREARGGGRVGRCGEGDEMRRDACCLCSCPLSPHLS